MNKKSLYGIVVCFLILFPLYAASATAQPETTLYVGINGGIPFLLSCKYVFGDIINTGDAPAYNVSWVFSITGGYTGDINVTYSYTEPMLPTKTAVGFLHQANGFGPVTITLAVSASNAESSTKTVHGFQIGQRTYLSFPLIRQLIFAFLLRYYVYWEHEQTNILGMVP
jgi:hypothetical protein